MGSGKSPVSAVPPAGALHKAADLIVLRAAAAHTPLVRSLLISPAGPSSPASFLQFSNISHPPGPAVPCSSLRGVFTQTGAIWFPCGGQSRLAAPVAKCASSHCWHLGQRHRNSLGRQGCRITRVQQLGYFRAGPRLRGWKCTFPTPRGRPYSPFLFRCKDTAFPPGVVSASCDCVLLCPFLVFGQDAPESQRKD